MSSLMMLLHVRLSLNLLYCTPPGSNLLYTSTSNSYNSVMGLQRLHYNIQSDRLHLLFIIAAVIYLRDINALIS